MNLSKLGSSIKSFTHRLKASASGLSTKMADSKFTKNMESTFKQKRKIELTTQIFNNIHTITIAGVVFEVDDLPSHFLVQDENSEEIATLLVKVFQDKYKATKFNGLPRVPTEKHAKELLVKVLMHYFDKERHKIFKYKNKGDSIMIRSKIDHLQKIKILIDHFMNDKETFPYDKFEEYLDNKDYIDAEEDIADALKHVGHKGDEDERIRSLLRQFAKMYLSNKKAHQFMVTDPGLSSDQLKELVATQYANKITPELLHSILKFMDDPLVIERLKSELHNAELARDVAEKEKVAAEEARDTLKGDIQKAEHAINVAEKARDDAEAAKKKAAELAVEVLRLEREQSVKDTKAALRELREESDQVRKDAEAAIRELKAEAEAAKLEATQKITEANDLAERAKAAKDAAEAQKAIAEAAKKTAEATATTALQAQTNAETERDDAIKKIATAEAEAAEAKNNLEEAKNKLDLLQATSGTNREILEEAEKRVNEAEIREKTANERADAAVESQKETEEKLKIMNEELTELKSNFANLEKERDEALEDSNRAVENMNAIEREANRLKSELDSREVSTGDLEENLRKANEKIKLLKSTLLGTSMSLNEKLNDAIKKRDEAILESKNAGIFVYELNIKYQNALSELRDSTIESAGLKEKLAAKSIELAAQAEQIATLTALNEENTDEVGALISKLVDIIPEQNALHDTESSIIRHIETYRKLLNRKDIPIEEKNKNMRELVKEIIQFVKPRERIIPRQNGVNNNQDGGRLLKHCKKIANNDIYDIPFALIEEFEVSSGMNVKRNANEIFMIECFLEEMFDTHFTSNTMKEFYFEAHLVLKNLKTDFYENAQMCYKLLEICKVIEKSKKDIDIVRFKSSQLNGSFDNFEQAIKNADYDFFTAAKNEIPSEINISFSKDHIYFYKNTNSFVNTYSINRSYNLDEENYEFNEELYFINDSVLKLFYIISNYLFMKNKLPTFKLGKDIEKFERTSKRKKNKQSKSIKMLLEERWEKNINPTK